MNRHFELNTGDTCSNSSTYSSIASSLDKEPSVLQESLNISKVMGKITYFVIPFRSIDNIPEGWSLSVARSNSSLSVVETNSYSSAICYLLIQSIKLKSD